MINFIILDTICEKMLYFTRGILDELVFEFWNR